MSVILAALDAALPFVRWLFAGTAAAVAVLGGVDWLVRTRRISPFTPVARFCRRVIDPLMAPVERAVVRAGGMPSSAPWWSLLFVVIAGIVVVSALDFVRGQLAIAQVYHSRGGLVILLVSWTFGILRLALLVRVLSSWIHGMRYSKWVRWSYALTDPFLAPLSRVIPPIGMVDISPIVAFFLLGFVERLVVGLL